jgi:hypothetical protein
MSEHVIDSATRERLADLWNRRHNLRKPEWLEFYELLTGRVWTRVNIHSQCARLLIEPSDARHDCFISRILTPARGESSTASTSVTSADIVGYLVKMLQRYLLDQLRRSNTARGGSQVINLGEEEWNALLESRGSGETDVTSPLLTAEFERRLRDEVLPAAEEFIRTLEREDLILLKCWYGQDPRPPLSWFGRIMPNPDFRARRLGLNLCRREYLDFGNTRIGRWARSLGLSLARDRYAEIHVILETIRLSALMEQTLQCASLDIGPPPPRDKGQATAQ